MGKETGNEERKVGMWGCGQVKGGYMVVKGGTE